MKTRHHIIKKNLHSHTQFCDGRCTMEEMLASARQAGFTTWGFSPHSPISVESPCNMKHDDVEKYLDEINRLRKLYPEMKILAGMEVDFIDEKNGPASEEIAGYGLDYIIGSVHFIPNKEGKYYDIDGSPERFRKVLEEHFDNDLHYVVRTFWQQTKKMIERGGLDIVGHIDKIALNASKVNPEIEDWPEYRQMAEETIEMALERGLAIEINTKHFRKYGRFFPHPRYWKKILEGGTSMPVNSDTHYSELVKEGMDEAYDTLDTLFAAEGLMERCLD